MLNKPTYEELELRIQELEYTEKEFKSLEEQLQDEVARRRLLVTESRDGIVVLNQACKVIEANKQFADILGYTMDEVMKLHAWDWDTEFTKEQILELAQSVDEKGHNFETRHRRKDGTLIDVELNNSGTVYKGQKLIFCIFHDITQRNLAAKEQERVIKELENALVEVNTLRGILPLCSFCKNIRDDDGYWEKVDVYIHKNSQASISHGICPDCVKEHYPEFSDSVLKANP